MYFINQKNFIQLLNKLTENYDVFIPSKKGDVRYFEKYEKSEISSLEEKGWVIGEVRTFEPIKAFFFRAREIVAENFKDGIPEKERKPACIVGAKSCDLKGLKVHDFVFESEDFLDPIYKKAREENLIISSDCTEAIETCYCRALELNPHPEEGYDINLSPVTGGFIVEEGSEKGKSIISDSSSLFEEVSDAHVKERDEQRKSVTKKVDENLRKYEIPKQKDYENIIQANYESSIWKDEASTCVECGACNTICPTCHCFLLYDQKSEDKLARLRIWDSCMIKDFAKVAAGVNPRQWLWMRLRNRFEKKFDFFPKIAGFYACTGCGRCISACPAKIDIRRVLKRLVDDAKKQPIQSN